jgi:hypothetical protein
MMKLLVGAALVGVAVASAALTIGPVRGDVWMEQPLELVVPLQLDSGAEPGASVCATAEVSYGDSVIDARWVRVLQEPVGDAVGGNYRLRVLASVPINEAVVTVLVQAGCEQKVTRRFQLLPDVAHLATAMPAVRTPVAEVPLAAIDHASPTGGAAAPVVAAQNTPALDKPVAAKRVKPSAMPGAAPAASPARKRAAQAPVPRADAIPTPHLTLDAVAVFGQRVATPEAASVAASPDAMQAMDELQKLRADYQGLQERANRNEAEFAAMRRHLEQAQADRSMVIAWAVGGFVALVVLVLGGLLWLGRRERVGMARVTGTSELDAEATALLEDFQPSAADKWFAPAKNSGSVIDDSFIAVDVDLTLPGPHDTPKP